MPADTKQFFRANNIHHGYDQTLWLYDETAITSVTMQNNNWQWPQETRLNLPYAMYDGHIQQLQSSDNLLWFVYDSSLFSVVRTTTGIDANTLQSLELPLNIHGQPIPASRITAMSAVVNTTDLYLAEKDSNSHSVLHHYKNGPEGISKVSSQVTSCLSIQRIYIANAHMLVSCHNAHKLYVKVDEQFTELQTFDAIEPIFMAPDNNTLIYLDLEKQEMVWRNLDDSTEQRQAKNFNYIYTINPQGDIFANATFNNVILQRQADNSYLPLNIPTDYPSHSFTIARDSTALNTVFYINGEHVLLGGGRHVIDTASGSMRFLGDDVWHQIRSTTQPKPLQNNSFIFMEESGSQIWQTGNGSLPLTPTLMPRLATADNAAVKASNATAYQQHWWQTGTQDNTAYLQHIAIDGTTQQISFPSPNSSSITQMQYYPDVDGLLLATHGGIIWWCEQATILEVGNCQQKLAFTESNLLPTQNGFLLYPPYSEGDIQYFQLSETGPELRWRKLMPKVEPQYWPGLNKVWLKQPSANGSNSITTVFALENGDAVASNNLTNNPPLEHCALSQNRLYCHHSNGIQFFLLNSSQTDVLSFTYDGMLQYGGNVVYADDNVQVLISDNKIFQYNLEIPNIIVGALPTDSEVWQDQDVLLDFSTIDNAEISLSSYAENLNWTPDSGWLFSVADNIWQVNTANEYAYAEPLLKILVKVLNGDWSTNYSLSIKLNNINDAPVATASDIYFEPIKTDNDYELSLSEIFTDPDNDILQYTFSNLPNGFRLESYILYTSPREAGNYNFTVTARDPDGLSATSTFHITVIADEKKENKPADAASGSVSFWMMYLILLCCGWRSIASGLNHPGRRR